MKIKIDSDVFNICERIKEIDKHYFIVFSTQRNRYEIHNSSQRGGSYCLTVPYSFLDERTLKLVEESRVENIDEILNKIKLSNELKESAEKTCAFNQFNELVEEKLKEE